MERQVELIMIQCKDCEFFRKSAGGEISFACDPFTNIKESECLLKWQLIKINQLAASYQATLDYYRKFAPMQEKMFKVVERELDDMNEGEKWKTGEGEDETEDDSRKTGGDWDPDKFPFQ